MIKLTNTNILTVNAQFFCSFTTLKFMCLSVRIDMFMRFVFKQLKTRNIKMGTLTNSETPDEMLHHFISVCTVSLVKIYFRQRHIF